MNSFGKNKLNLTTELGDEESERESSIFSRLHYSNSPHCATKLNERRVGGLKKEPELTRGLESVPGINKEGKYAGHWKERMEMPKENEN